MLNFNKHYRSIVAENTSKLINFQSEEEELNFEEADQIAVEDPPKKQEENKKMLLEQIGNYIEMVVELYKENVDAGMS